MARYIPMKDWDPAPWVRANMTRDAWIALVKQANEGDKEAAAIIADVFEEAGHKPTAEHWRSIAAEMKVGQTRKFRDWKFTRDSEEELYLNEEVPGGWSDVLRKYSDGSWEFRFMASRIPKAVRKAASDAMGLRPSQRVRRYGRRRRPW